MLSYGVRGATMPKQDFEKSFEFLIKVEGGFVDHPNDPGGPTKFGITQATTGWDRETIKNLTPEVAKKWYFDNYWKPSGADKLPWPLNLAVFDFAVHSGIQTARNHYTPGMSANEYVAARLNYLTSLTDLWEHFGRGWMRRIMKLMQVMDDENPEYGLIQVFEGDKHYNYYPVKQTEGEMSGGKAKLMVRIEPRGILEKIRQYF